MHCELYDVLFKTHLSTEILKIKINIKIFSSVYTKENLFFFLPTYKLDFDESDLESKVVIPVINFS